MVLAFPAISIVASFSDESLADSRVRVEISPEEYANEMIDDTESH